MIRHPFRAAALAAATLAWLPAAAAEAQPGPPVTVEAVLVSPKDPGPETLCKLSVRLKSHADRSVSSLGFRVTVNGVDLPVYTNQRYLEVLDPGETKELALFNFWSSETHRPPAGDGSLAVEVALVEARWVERSVEEGIPTWTLLDEVKGLPSAKSVRKPFPGG
jgi:hypothetical protein